MTLIHTRKIYRRKENYTLISMMNNDVKILDNLLANCIQHCVNKVLYDDQFGFSPEVRLV